MKLLFVIDSLGSGGAQNQLSLLSLGMIARGHSVELFNYFPQHNFYRDDFVEAGVKIYDYHKAPGIDFRVIGRLRSLLKKNSYDIVLSFLDAPNICLILASIGLNVKVVVSERNSYMAGSPNRFLLQKQLLRFADMITVNSSAQAKWLINMCRLSANHIMVIRNGYAQTTLRYSPLTLSDPNDLKLLGIGRITPQKNLKCLITGLTAFYKKHGWVPSLNWAGKTDNNDYAAGISKLLDENPDVKAKWSWLGERKDIPDLLASHHVFILSSSYEGLPNAVCEAMFAGKPILCSDVCDNPYLVKDGTNGFLFAPDSAQQLAEAIEKFISLNPSQQLQISLANRKFAEQNLNLEVMVNLYESLFKDLLK